MMPGQDSSDDPLHSRLDEGAHPIEDPIPAKLLLVTGMSGAGRTMTLRFLEDLGYEALDNLPLKLLDSAFRLAMPDVGPDVGPEAGHGPTETPVAIGIDTRTRDFDVQAILERLDRTEDESQVELLFVDCEDQTLRRRFTETRRLHPLAKDRPITDSIMMERAMIAPLRSRADWVIDTSRLTLGDLKRILKGHFGQVSKGLSVFVTSFSFREGLPREADLVLDVRFLRNPHYEPTLRAKDGRDPDVGHFITEDPAFAAFLENFKNWFAPLLPRYEGEGKSYLTLAIGCTGGKHRSVFVTEQLGCWLQQSGWRVTTGHRELQRTTQPA